MIGMLLIGFFFLVEGPNFLYGQKREKECLEALRTIAVINNRLDEFNQAEVEFRYESTEEEKKHDNPVEAVKAVFRNV
jgi:hypothetical protein